MLHNSKGSSIKGREGEILKRSLSMENYQKASASILARIIMFNRRRSRETSKILPKDHNGGKI
ncbi:hypothetical protein KUTeg_007606 [Tegillarca granosa]|uniref:Uncharacterized protein n=1 Tax=Tegillarca granosa TaxID=220873 RepID=A0ABQ9FDT2_TEGGR|nr:hypothetical protein KUTeg_007606 [Tegillarca granosa]